MTVTEARKRWGELLDRVERGETVSVSRHGKVIAAFVPDRTIAPINTTGGNATIMSRAAQAE